jgi:hypothetical protein
MQTEADARAWAALLSRVDEPYLRRVTELTGQSEPWHVLRDAVERAAQRARLRLAGQSLAIIEAAKERFERIVAGGRTRQRAPTGPSNLTSELLALLSRHSARRGAPSRP